MYRQLKKGDKVESLENHGKLLEGKIYTFEKYDRNGYTGKSTDIICTKELGINGWYIMRFKILELIKEYDEPLFYGETK